MNAPAILLLTGLAMTLAAWTFFRLPGRRFWTTAPVWQAARYLRPAGAVLWGCGFAAGMVGATWIASRYVSLGG